MVTQQAEIQARTARYAARRKRSPFGRGLMPPVTEVIRTLRSSPPLFFELNELLGKACENGETRKALGLLGLGADVNARDFEGRTPLMQAAKNLRLTTARMLIKKGALVNATDGQNRTALMLAANNTDPVIFRIRRRTGPASPEDACRSVLMVEMLLERNARLDARDAQRSSALDYAVARGNRDVEVLLRAYGATQ